jgi:AraC-like DNA-binding protein
MQKQPFSRASAKLQLPTDFPVLIDPLYVLGDSPIKQLHFHNMVEFGVCHKGSGLFVIEDKMISFSKGDCIIIPGDQVHRAQSQKGTTSQWSWVYTDFTRLLAPFLDNTLQADASVINHSAFPYQFSAAQNPGICRLLLTIVQELQQKEAGYQSIVRSQVVALLVLLARLPRGPSTVQSGKKEAAQRKALQPAVDYICQHYTEPIAIGTLARACAMSLTHFRRIFSQMMGKSPLDYLLHFRISMAAVELRETAKPISTIAFDAGFQTLSSFNRKFKEQRQMAPREFRKKGSTSCVGKVINARDERNRLLSAWGSA